MGEETMEWRRWLLVAFCSAVAKAVLGRTDFLRAFCLAIFMMAVRGAVAEPFPHPALFGTPVGVPGIPSITARMTLTPDGLHMVFSHGAVHNLYTADWDDALHTWGNITHLTLGSGGGGWETMPSLSPDGNWLFYEASDGSSWVKLYRSVRQPDGSWGAGEPVQGAIQVFDREADSFFDGYNLYFAHALTPGAAAYLYRSPYDASTDTFGEPVALSASINDGVYHNRFPTVVGDGQTLLFARERTANDDIWIAQRSGDDWGQPQNPNWAIRTDASESGPWYHAATRTVYFVRDGVPMQSTAAVPEPFSLAFVGSAFVGVVAIRLRTWRKDRQ